METQLTAKEKWIKIEKPETVANNFRFLIERIICIDLESGQSIRFITRTNKRYDSLFVEYSSLTKERIASYLNDMRQYYDFKINYISDCSFVIRDIEDKKLQAS